MIVDIEGREINNGDECYMPYNNSLMKIIVTRESKASIFYKIYNRADKTYNDIEWYLIKTGKPAKNLLKVC